MRIRREWLVAAALLLLAPAASAQGIARTFDQLQLLVRPGDTVTVRDAQGNETSGRIDSLSASTLTLGRGDTRRDFREADVTTIRQRRQDSLANGALWGLVSGAGVALIPIALCGDDCDIVVAAIIPVYAGLGAGIGVGVDALIARRQVIFERARAAAGFRMAPLVGRGRRGVMLAVTF